MATTMNSYLENWKISIFSGLIKRVFFFFLLHTFSLCPYMNVMLFKYMPQMIYCCVNRAASQCRGNDKENMLQYILNAAPQLTDVRNMWGETALFLACKTNASFLSIKAIIQSNPQCVTIADDNYKTVLCQCKYIKT
jgi:hypothetical protein